MRHSPEDPELNWLLLDSSALKATAYLPAERMLYLEFHDGDRYRYFEFPPERFEDFLAAESKGTYFVRQIRNHFDYEQLPKTHHAGG
jgi:KTSC domain